MELVSRLVIPVVIGNGASAHRLALRLCLKYGVRSTLCGLERSIWDLFNPFSEFLRVPAGDGDLLAKALKDYSAAMEDYILILLPADERGRLFLEEYRDSLESFYILASSYEQFEKLPPIRLA